jgi:GNAT superfamily N-acetyltransferase
MTTRQRSYKDPADFDTLSDFLTRHYQPENRDGNWFQPVWEYAYTHPYLDASSLGRIGIWEDGAHEVVAVANYESRLGEAFFHTHPDYAHLKPEMLAYAEAHLAGTDEQGIRYLNAYVNDFDTAFEEVVVARGYRKEAHASWTMSQFVIPTPFPPISLPAGFRVQSLAEENDLHKMHRVLHRGFNHPGEPPEDELQGRVQMQSGPNFRPDLTTVVVAPNGDFVSYSGMWYDPVNRFGYVEPVATDPDYRRLGLGKTAVLGSIQLCAEQGATVAYVGSDLPFYLAIGFKRLHTQNCWLKRFADGNGAG